MEELLYWLWSHRQKDKALATRLSRLQCFWRTLLPALFPPRGHYNETTFADLMIFRDFHEVRYDAFVVNVDIFDSLNGSVNPVCLVLSQEMMFFFSRE